MLQIPQFREGGGVDGNNLAVGHVQLCQLRGKVRGDVLDEVAAKVQLSGVNLFIFVVTMISFIQKKCLFSIYCVDI